MNCRFLMTKTDATPFQAGSSDVEIANVVVVGQRLHTKPLAITFAL